MTREAEAALLRFDREKAAKQQAEIRKAAVDAQAAAQAEAKRKLAEAAYLATLEVGEFIRVRHRNNVVLAQTVDRRNDKVYMCKYIRTRNCWLKPRQLYCGEVGERISTERAEDFCFRGEWLSPG